MAEPNDLIIFTDEEGYPWAAFVWGAAISQEVAALITIEAVEDATGYTEAGLAELGCSWPPNVQPYWLKALDDETYQICAESDDGAQRITGHRFYPQG
ncbi:hypothetical protein GCM10010873_26960 [Cypionkella aquatica]|uniref:Uncharacterized protein n=1 Tax=Cypionkella aquatica TaxID=1756042 RepID=A0AA37X102_9RHOB|nr:hypothetical protein [Cypionkella aquatica]GLS87722.1 hypothetical protein GCM10010873_26960 [Cypionkella aquatica]